MPMALAALAVLGEAEGSTLCQMLGIDLQDPLLAALRKEPAVESDGSKLRLTPAAAALHLEALEEQDFLHFQHLHRRALQLLAPHLGNDLGDAASTERFVTIFRRLAERLLNQDPQHLVDLVEQVRPLPLPPAARAYRELYTAIALRNSDRYAEALAVLEALLAQEELESEVRGRALNAAAICHFLLGHLQQALDGYYASLALWQELGNVLQEGLVLLNIGIAAYEVHNYAEAESSLRRAESCFTRCNALTWLASVHNELGLVYRDLGRWQEAIGCFQQCIERRRAEGAHNHVAYAVNNLGEVYLLQGEWQGASTAFAGALQGMISQSFRVDVLLNLGFVHLVQGDLLQAQGRLQEALALAQQIERQDILPMLHYRYGDLRLRQGQAANALEHFEQGIRLVEQMRAPLRAEEVKISLLGRWQQLYEQVVLLHLQAGHIDEALTTVERARARAFLDLLATPEENTNLPLEGPLSAQEIMAHLAPRVALVAFFPTGQPGTLAPLLASLPPSAEALRNYLLPAEQLLAFVVTAKGVHAIPLPARLAQIEAQHFQRGDGRLRGTNPSPGQPLAGASRWRELGRALLHPLTPYLQGVEHLVFVPHSLLHYLPLHALAALDELTGVEGTTASYAPSASIFLRSAARRGKRPSTLRSLAVGVDDAGLSNAEAEAKRIAHHLAGDALTGAAATPDAVCHAIANYEVIHFSCHGLFRQRTPMQSALMLAGGELRALDLLAGVRLNAEIVTLSACDTALNQLTPGDELLGFTRAFLGAGARSLLVALWPVHEIPTRLFMEHFYAAWSQGASKAAALGSAQRFVATLEPEQLRVHLESYGFATAEAADLLALFAQMLPGPHPFAHPYYWAAFILTGDAE